MKPLHKALALVVLCACLAGWESWRIGRQRTRLAALARETGRMMTELTGLEDDRRVESGQWAAAKDDLAALQDEFATNAAGRPGELAAWSKRVNHVKELFARQPDRAIPELSLLTTSDWLRIGRDAQLDSDEGIPKALADARSTAKYNLSMPLDKALRAYKRDHNDSLPGAATELQPYFDPPLDPAILLRYRMALTGPVDDAVKGTYALTEQAAIDPEYDVRWDYLAGNGLRVMSWPLSELDQAQDDARVAYARANDGRPAAGLADLLPYVQSPGLREITRGMADYMAAHGGRQTTDAAELLPYFGTEEARTLAAKIWPKRN